MEQVDSIVNDTCIQLLQEQQSTLRFKNESEGELLKRVCQLESKILKNASKRRDAREYIRRYNTGDLYLLHETRFDGGWDTKPLWYPFTLHSGTLEHAIAEFSVLGENVSFRCDFGGKNQSYYVMFRLMQKQDAYVHVKAFIQKKRIFQQEIENYKDKLRKYARTHEILVNNLREYPVNDEKYKSIKPIFDTQRKYLELQRLMSSSTVSPEILAALLEADVYSGTLSECAAKVERVYLDCISKGLVTEGDDKVGEFGIFGGLSGNEGGEHHSAIGELDDCINFDRTQSNTNIYSIAPKPMDAPPLLSKSYLAWISGIGIFKSSEKKLVSCATIQSKNELK
ncbi:hypothetical protein BGZ76_002875 [Entomortierella beljakovae]|nr:hypothetical protein BGZ76_002875 [Entomortierella beljakovae]